MVKKTLIVTPTIKRKKVLFVSPEIPSGGTGVYIWQLAQAAKKWSGWEAHIVSPMLKPQEEIARTLDGYHKVNTNKRKMFSEGAPLQLLEEAALYAKDKDFDLVYFNGSHEFLPKSYLIKTFKNSVCSIHYHEPYLRKFNSKKPITEQFDSLEPSKLFDQMMACRKNFKAVQLISNLESKIFNQLTRLDPLKYRTGYIVYPDLLYSTEKYCPENYEDRSDRIMLSGRVTSYIKGLEIIRNLVDTTDLEFTITVPYGSVARAKKFLGNKKNCEVLYYPKHEDALKELAQHKVFCNPGTYGPFDLTMVEAANQGCQIVANSCVGATNYLTDYFKPEDHTAEAFEKAIKTALKEKGPSRNAPSSMEVYIQDFLETLYWMCEND